MTLWTGPPEKIGELRKREGVSISPSSFPDERFEPFSVPSFVERTPESILGVEVASGNTSVTPDTVLLGKINPRINRVWKIGTKGERRQVASTEWIQILTTDELDPDFLRLYLTSNSVRDYAASNISAVGGSLMRIRPSVLDDVSIPASSREEQRIIVEKVETEFARTGDAVVLERTRTRLVRYRASVLKAACKGRLVSTDAELARQEGRSYDPASVLMECIKDERAATPSNNQGRRSQTVDPDGGSRTVAQGVGVDDAVSNPDSFDEWFARLV